jgi:endonuclease/exonuclease/phosphatase family metal-dependent hydrolase
LVYRPPAAPVNSILELEEAVKTAGKNSLLIGDFNLPDIDWERGIAGGRSADFVAAVEDNMMEQLVTFPTQEKGNTLDLVITNIPERIEEVSEHGRLGKSDHVIIVTKVKTGKQQVPVKQLLDWRRADWDAMRADLRRERIRIL